MPSNIGSTGCWRKIDAAFHRPLMYQKQNTRSPSRTAQQTKPSKPRKARRLAYTSSPKTPSGIIAKRRGGQSGELLRNGSAVSE
jgi:hypothetical protein